MNLKTLLAGTALCAAVVLGPMAAQASIINGSFETGDLTGWSGSASVVTQSNGYGPTGGNLFASMFANSTLSQTFTTTGGILEGDIAFLAHDYMPFNDYGYVKLFDLSTSTELFSANVASVGDFGETAWTHFSTSLAAGSYTIEAGVFNAIDDFNTSQLLLDNVSVGVGSGGVPEPATWAMMLTGFFGLGSMLRMRRRVAVATV